MVVPGMGTPWMVLYETPQGFLSLSPFLPCLGLQWALPANNNTGMRCEVLCLALDNQKSLCNQAWGQWLRGSVT